jgi:predicted nucleic acid-binding protein
VVHRATGAERARAVVGDLRHRLSLDLPTEVRVLEAAAIKARHALAYADAFAIATAVAHRASLLTGDPEILDGGDPTWPVVDLRS